MSKNNPNRIAFGSCNHQSLDQPLWPIIESRNVSAFIWGGDAIYADTRDRKGKVKCVKDAETFERKYQEQLGNDGYDSFLRNSKAYVFGIMDDHDFGCNNGDRTYELAKESGYIFLNNFIRESNKYNMLHEINKGKGGEKIEEAVSRDSPMYERAKKGLGVYGVKVFDFSRSLTSDDSTYSSYLVSDEDAAIDPDLPNINNKVGKYSKEKSVAIFMLDVRTNKSPWYKKGSPTKEGDFLGERQWEWFEKALNNSHATIHIIDQGVQVHPIRFHDTEVAEMWDKYPVQQSRFYDLILKHKLSKHNYGDTAGNEHKYTKMPFLISGDVHMANLMRKDCYHHQQHTSMENSNNNNQPNLHHTHQPTTEVQSILELTTSGMTHSWGTCFSAQKRFHDKSNNYWLSTMAYFASRNIMQLSHYIIPMPDLLKYSLELNFAEMEFDWDEQRVVVKVFGIDTTSASKKKMKNLKDFEGDAKVLFSDSWTFDELNGDLPMKPKPMIFSGIKQQNELLQQGQEQWTCTPYKGPLNQGHFVVSQVFVFCLIMLTVFVFLSPGLFIIWIIAKTSYGLFVLCVVSRIKKLLKGKSEKVD